jgi:hypothetical protein
VSLPSAKTTGLLSRHGRRCRRDDDAAAGAGRDAGQVVVKVLGRERLLQSGEGEHPQDDAFARAAVAVRHVTTALGTRVSGSTRPCRKAVRVEPVRLGPVLGVVVGAVHVEHDQPTAGDPHAQDVLRGPGAGGQDRDERVEPLDLLHECVQSRVVTGRDALAPLGVLVKGLAGELDEPRDRDRGPHDVEHGGGGHALGQQPTLRVAGAGGGVER